MLVTRFLKIHIRLSFYRLCFRLLQRCSAILFIEVQRAETLTRDLFFSITKMKGSATRPSHARKSEEGDAKTSSKRNLASALYKI